METLQGFTLDDLEDKDKEAVLREWLESHDFDSNGEEKKSDCNNDKSDCITEKTDVTRKIDDYLFERWEGEDGDIDYTVDSVELLEKLEILSKNKQIDCWKWYSLLEKSKNLSSEDKKIISLLTKYKKIFNACDSQSLLIVYICKMLLVNQALNDHEHRNELIRASLHIPNNL